MLRYLSHCLLVLALVGAWGTSFAASRSPADLAIQNMAAQHTQDAAAPAVVPAIPASPQAAGAAAEEYVLGPGDEIKMTVYGEDDLSGQYVVGSTGVVALPLIGNIDAAKLTIRQLEDAVRAKLAVGYLKDPRVSIQVLNYRPFFILGEVAKPGSYPYVNAMTVLNAAALAGGYTYRADRNDIRITRADDPTKTEKDVGEDEPVKPGDIIRVPERFF